MSEGRWRLALGPVLAALGVGLLLGSAALDATGAMGEAADDSPAVPGCAGPAPGSGAWYQLVERSDRRGALSGYELRFGSLVANAPAQSLAAPAESHAAGPFGGVVLYGTDDGRHSEVRLLVAATGCSARAAASRAVIRRSTIDRAGTSLYYHLVDRETRGDLGIWRRTLGGQTPAVRVLPPLANTALEPGVNALGRVFSTEFAWAPDDVSLAVQACGATRCETRILDTASGAVARYAAPEQGEMLGVTGELLISYRACHGLPCAIVATERSTGRVRDVVPAAEAAILTDQADGGVVLFERPGAPRYELVALGLAHGTIRTVYRTARADLRLLTQSSRSLAGASAPPGWAVLAPPEGLGKAGGTPRVLRLSDGFEAPLKGDTR